MIKNKAAYIEGGPIAAKQPTLYDVQKILLEKGAITAANLDGGSSSVMVKDHKLINRPSSHYGMRYLPSAFLIFDKPNEVVVDNL